MGDDVRVKLKISGINKLMTSAPVVADVSARAQRIARAAGEGFVATVDNHKWTARAYIRTATTEARKREASQKVLIRSLSAGA